MADLTDIQTAESVKIIGSDSTGVESTPVKASANGDLGTSDIMDNGGTNGNLSVGTSAVEVKVGGSVLANRKYVIIVPLNDMYFGFSSGVTTSNGIPVFANQTIMLPLGPNTSVWLIASGSSRNARIAEIA